MNAHETTFRDLVHGEKQFQIPLYQRPYSWGERDLRRLWDDILEQAEALRDGGGPTSHFIGSVVMAPSPATSPAFGQWLVVDGQQRLTTLMLALCAIRDHVSADEPMTREKINEHYLLNKFKSGDARYRLLPTKADRDAYKCCIEATPAADRPGNIGDAYRFFQQRIAAADDPADPYDVARIQAAIEHQLVLVEVTADAHDNVYRIFESLNNTGMGLSQADLVRNLVFMLLPTRGEQVYDSDWLPMQRRVADSLEDLIYLTLVVGGNERLRKHEIYEAMREKLNGAQGDEEEVAAIVRDLARRARHLERILHPSLESDPRLRAVFTRLNTWGAVTVHPVLMRLLDLQERGVATTDEIVEAVGYVESFIVRRMICAVPTNNLNRIFSGIGAGLRDGPNVALPLREALSSERNYWPDDGELRSAMAAKPFYWQGRPNQRHLILQRLAEAFQDDAYPSAEKIDFEASRLTIEHVMPQTPPAEWLDQLATEAEDGETAEELHRRLLHTLGNLTLTGDNPGLSNHMFKRKQELLTYSKLEMNRRIASRPRWGKQQIIERASELADRAVALWPAPLAVRQKPTREWAVVHEALASVPAGAWTTYSELGELVGVSGASIGIHLAATPVPNAHRALTAGGTLGTGFRWPDPHDERDPADVLRQEGVTFDEHGVADSRQRVTARELADLIGLDTGELAPPPEAASTTESLHRRFLLQLKTRHGDQVAEVAQQLTNNWKAMGGRLNYGAGALTSCFLVLDRDAAEAVWPLALYPYGSAEVVFQYLRSRPPFDDVRVRDGFRRRLNDVPGIDIPQAKLSLRPSFPLQMLVDAGNYTGVLGALRWFVEVARTEDVAPLEAAG